VEIENKKLKFCKKKMLQWGVIEIVASAAQELSEPYKKKRKKEFHF
jgi:hypothetical protein